MRVKYRIQSSGVRQKKNMGIKMQVAWQLASEDVKNESRRVESG